MAYLQYGKTKIRLHISSETEDVKNTVSTYPIQSGNAITDHTQRESQTWTLEGYILAAMPKVKTKKKKKKRKNSTSKRRSKKRAVKKKTTTKKKTKKKTTNAHKHKAKKKRKKTKRQLSAITRAGNAYKTLVKWQYHGRLLKYIGVMHEGSVMIEEISRTNDGIKNGYKVTINLRRVNIIGRKKKKRHAGTKKAGKGKRKHNKRVYVTVKRGNSYWGWHLKYGTSVSKLRKWNGWKDRSIPIGKKARVK